ncbi:MAG: HAD-IA family hydrolase, partial [Bacillota bacterium]|nr:HAD-IA family hydrolase [Bacillota bacterium]
AADYYISRYGVDKTNAEITDEINRIIEDFYICEAPLKPGAGEFLKQLHDKGTVMCVATTIDKNIASGALKRCGVYKYFVDIITCGDTGSGKDEPEIFEKALACLGTEKKYTYVFEDALHAAETAKRAGFPVAGVFDASEASQSELKACADIYLSDFEEGSSFLI